MFETKLATEVLPGDRIRYRGAWYLVESKTQILDSVVFIAVLTEGHRGVYKTIEMGKTDYPGWWRYGA